MSEGVAVPTQLSASVIIITYRRPDHVRECLRHLSTQTHPPLEVLVVDASPEDHTRKVVEQDPAARYLRNNAGAGTMATSRQIGLREAKGDIVVFFDDDAYADPDCLEHLLREFADPSVGGVGGRASNAVPGEETEGVDQIGRFLPNGTLTGFFGANPGRAIDVDHILGAHMSWRRSALLQVGGVHDLYPGTCLREDTDIALRVSGAGWRIRYTPFALVRHVAGPYAKGKRFDRRYTFYANRNHIVLLVANLGWASPQLRRFIGVALAEAGGHVRRALTFYRSGDIRSAGRTLIGGLTRPLWILAGLGSGVAAASRIPQRIDTDEERIWFVLPEDERYSPSGGAIATVIRNQVQALTSLGHHPRVVAARGERYPEGEFVGLPRLPYRLAVRAALRAARRQDVVVLANDAPLASKLASQRYRVVLWLHNLPEFDQTARVANLPVHVTVVAVSDMVRDWTIEHCALDPRRIVTVPNAVDTTHFTPRANWVDPVKPVRVICHGRIDPNKGYDVAALAVAELQREGWDVSFTLVGEVKTFGWPDDLVRQYVHELDAALDAAHATRTGRVPPSDVASLLADHDIACVLSKSAEPFGLAALEAMAAGCAVIVTDGGALPEVVGDAGTVIEPDSVDATAAALRALIEDVELLSVRKRAARARSLEFGRDRAADRLLAHVATLPGTGT